MEEIIKHLEAGIKECEERFENMDESYIASVYRSGVLITENQAKQIVEALKKVIDSRWNDRDSRFE